MSAKDSQFIERALVHPWMFWVFFWKWPRILRQVCGEYDLVAKDRDAAKAAHEQAVAANEKVRKWIHVTHQLDATADLRAIWTAGKRLSILLVFFVVTNTYGQAPPYLRNQWTTNANPLALKVISTNGVHAATNVWELDFTNTATVTVSAVSNANKVMVSFTGSASSSSSLTNALLHAGPTNGSVGALVLTAGNGVTLTTSGTNRIAAIDTNVVAEISDLLWTNVPSGNAELGDILTPVEQYGMFQLATNSLSWFGDQSSLLAFGYPAVDLAQIGTNAAAVILLGDLAGGSAVISNGSFFVVGIGAGALRSSVIDASTSVYAIGDDALRSARIQNNVSRILAFGTDAFKSSRLMDNTAHFTGFGLGVFDSGIATNSSKALFAGSSAGIGTLLVDVSYLLAVGHSAFGSSKASNSIYLTAIGHLAGSSSRITNTYDINLVGAYTGFGAILSRVTNAFAIGYETLMNANLRRVTGVFAADYGAMKGAVLTNCDYVLAVGYDAFENAILTNCNQIHAFGSYAGTNLVLTGKTNVFIFGNVGTIAPANEEFWFGNTNNVYRFPGNIGTIRGLNYSWPTAHASGVLTDDGSGNLSWAAGGSGGGIASVYTNNVLAGGPGLTELGFTNSGTVSIIATTNAGRVTVSFDASAANSGIATNAGTGWDTSFRSVSTNTVPVRINSEAGLRLTNFFQVATNGGVPFFVVASNQFVGIGTNGPVAPLHVMNGNVKIGAGGLHLDGTGSSGIGMGTAAPGTYNMIISIGAVRLRHAGGDAVQVEASSGRARLNFGTAGNASAPSIINTNMGHMVVGNALGDVGVTNALFFSSTADTTASTGMTMNRQTGRVRLASGSQTYLVTNNLATANSIVTATVNSDDANALSVKAIPSAGLITLKVNAATAADTDISFLISAQ